MSKELDFLYLTEEEMIEAGALNMSECITTLEEMFKLISAGDYIMGGPKRNDHGLMLWFNEEEPFENMPTAGPDRRFMSLIAYLGGNFDVVGNKWYGSNINNFKKGLPRSIHTFTLNDKDTGAPLSIMAGNLISSVRTGAVPGVVSKYLAKKDSKILGAIGGGAINQSCVEAITTTVSGIEKVVLFDIDLEKGKEIASSLEQKIGITVVAVNDMKKCTQQADIISIATSGKNKPELKTEDIKSGALILATGAVNFSEALLQDAHIFSDLWSMHEKWLEDGLSHPDGISSILSWTMSGQLLELINKKEFNSERIKDIGDVIMNKEKGRNSEDEIIISMTGGLPTEDVAWGYKIYESAMKKDLGTSLKLWENSYLT